MNAEIADIICGDKRLADFFESFGHIFTNEEMNSLANLLANDVLRELNYRELKMADIPMEGTLFLRWYIIRRIKEPMDRKEFTVRIRAILDILKDGNHE